MSAVTSHEALLDQIKDYCQANGVSETTFGVRAVNDGKLVPRLRDGKTITLRTLRSVQSYLETSSSPLAKTTIATNATKQASNEAQPAAAPKASAVAQTSLQVLREATENGERAFRFFDNRQKYLLFVHTCSEKLAVAHRVSRELANIHPQPPAVRIFDAGVGDGTVLAQVMRSMHARFPTMPHYVAGKEISLEDVRLALEKMPDRFFEHPSTVLVLTNMYYSQAPWLRVNSPAAAHSLIWHELALEGQSSYDFADQIADLKDFLGKHWTAKASPKTGNPIYNRPIVLVIYRKDHEFLLDAVRPRQGVFKADYDLIIASQPYRLRVPAEFKAEKVVAPLASALGPGGRLLGVHSHGRDPGEEIIRNVWPDENPFQSDRHEILQATKNVLGKAQRDLTFNAYSNARSLLRYEMHTLPNELSGHIGTSTLFAAWNAAIYVAQIEDAKLTGVVNNGSYVAATDEVLKRYGGLWFNDETYVISRKMA